MHVVLFLSELIFALLLVFIACGWTLLDLHARYPCDPRLIGQDDGDDDGFRHSL